MSHEIRTPMNGVLGMIEMLYRGVLPPKYHRYAEVAKSSGLALQALLNDLLDYSKMEVGKLDLEEHRFELRALLREVVEAAGVAAAAKGLTIKLDMKPGRARSGVLVYPAPSGRSDR